MTTTTGREVVVRLPMPATGSGLWPNDRAHHMAKHRATVAARFEAWAETRKAWGTRKPMERAMISWRFEFCRKRRHDLDNCHASVKAYQDGIADVLLMHGDGPTWLGQGAIKVIRHKHKAGDNCAGSVVVCTVREVE